MLVIREAQMEVFRGSFLARFENRRLLDIAKRFPTRYAELGENGTRKLIKFAIKACERSDIHGEGDVENVIDLMVVYGQSFDSDPKYGFETALLHKSGLPGDARVGLTMARFGLEPGFHE
jgi:hypothetical protein